jgi:ABC-2 type transport system ATP-binding protein
MLEILDVSRSFGSTQALRGVGLSIPAGMTVGLLGPNGAGKTTLMRTIVGIAIPDTGSVRWNGAPIDAVVRKRFGYLPEERGLYPKLKAREQIRYFGMLHGLPSAQAGAAADEWIERLRLGAYASKVCGALSKGNQQKVQIACAVAHRPELLILDEPFSGLDIENGEALLEALRELKRRGTTMLLSSHQLWQIETMCDRFAIVAAGCLRAYGTLADLRATWGTRTIRVSPPTSAVRSELAKLRPVAQRATDDAVEVDVARDVKVDGLAGRLAAAVDIAEFSFVEPPLSAIYARAIEFAA